MRDEETLQEIEDFIEGFNQPPYRGMRINGQWVATWSARDGWSQGYKARCGMASMKISVADNIWKSSLVERTSK
jgi:hypothetical protein